MYRLVIQNSQHQNGQIALTSEQQHYLHRVLRLQKGDRFVVMDGQGKAWIAQLIETYAQILEPLYESTELAINITLMVALPKGNGFDDIVRGCTELGVATFVAVISERTLLKPSPHKLERWRKIAAEAAEQSERQIVPNFLEPMNFSTALAQLGESETDHYICVTRREANLLLTDLQNQPTQNLVIATGPEGGWTDEEVEKAISQGFKPVSLGRRILRAVTAPIVAVSLATAIAEQNRPPAKVRSS